MRWKSRSYWASPNPHQVVGARSVTRSPLSRMRLTLAEPDLVVAQHCLNLPPGNAPPTHATSDPAGRSWQPRSLTSPHWCLSLGSTWLQCAGDGDAGAVGQVQV